MNKLSAREIADAIIRYKQVKGGNQLYFYKPYKKQTAFHESGAEFSQRCLGAGNQLGKTYSGAMEASFHATGIYPSDWKGRIFSEPNVGWVCGVSGEVIRDTTQKLLLGRVQDEGQLGTGGVPSDNIIECKKALGVPGLLDHAVIKHKTGGSSLIFFKSYEKGREKFQGETIDWIWFDEEPPMDIYIEGLTRTNNGQNGQFAWMTFTPLKGMTDVVMQFYKEPTRAQCLTMMTIHDVDHYTAEEKASIIESYPPHQREARSKGVPILGDGRVFEISEERISCTPFEIPGYWPRIKGIDFGWDHPTACSVLAYDPDNDIIYVYGAFKEREVTASEFSIFINKKNSWIPVSWPHDGLQHDKGSGIQLAQSYRDCDVNMLERRATFEDGTNSVEAGNMQLLDRMRTGRFKVFSHLEPWFEEFRLYHRKDGKLVKVRDDLLSSTRYGYMMLRYAVSEQEEFSNHDNDDDRTDTGYW